MIFGHFGGGNLGNESTLQAMLYHLRNYLPNAEVTCICTGPEATMRTHNIAAVPIARQIGKQGPRSNIPLVRFFRKIVIKLPRELIRCFETFCILHDMDMLVVAGTGLLTDAYGIFGWGPYNLFKWSLIAKIRGCRLLFVSVGAGPIYGGLSRWMIVSALHLADFRSYRDISSMKYLESIGFARNNDRVYPDLAFSLPAKALPHNDSKNWKRPIVGIGLMGNAGSYSSEKPCDAIYMAYLENLAAFVRWLLTREYDVRLLVGEIWHDKPVIQEFKGLLKKHLLTHEAGHIIDEPVFSVRDLLSQIATTSFVVATRFHNVLLSLLLNKPVISISFHHKCVSLMNQIGLSQFCNDINHLDASKLIEQFGSLKKDESKLRLMIRERARELRGALDEQYSFIFREMWHY